ncbi:hypothetical protein H0H93_008239, partial [Arthromyces matolae]
LFIVLLIQFAEPLTATVIYPFINQFVRDTGVTEGDERRTGYYAGIIESTFFIAEGLTVVYWGRASDYFGRRHILLLGPLGLALAMLSFGLSSNFLSMVLSRCMQGVFNGNIGVSKTVVAEITDSTNVADAFALMPLVWTTGTTIAPIIGGLLSQPAKRWPDIFGNIPFFQSLFTAIIGFLGLKETLRSAVIQEKQKAALKQCSSPDASTPLLSGCNDQTYLAISTDATVEYAEAHDVENTAPPSLREVLTRRIVLILVIFAFMTFMDISLVVLQPLVYSTSISLGGLDFSPHHTGAIMGTWGVASTIFSVFFLPRFVRAFGARRVQMLVFCGIAIELFLYPLMRYLVQKAGGVDVLVWGVLILQLVFALFHCSAYGEAFSYHPMVQILNDEHSVSLYMLIIELSPTQAALGTTNGMLQAVASATRSIGPTLTSSLFSISLERNLAGGNMVFMVLFVVVTIGVRLTFLLPKPTPTVR